MLDQLADVETRFLELEKLLSNPDTISDKNKYRDTAKEHAGLYQIVEKYREYNKISREIQDNKELLNDKDAEIKELARSEIEELTEKKNSYNQRVKDASYTERP